MTSINVGGRELALEFNFAAMDEMEKLLDTKIDVQTIQTELLSLDQLKDRHRLVPVLVALIHAGEELQGRDASDVTTAWLSRHLRISHMQGLLLAVASAVNEGCRMETAEEDNGPVDVVLEELKKNPPPSPSDT